MKDQRKIQKAGWIEYAVRWLTTAFSLDGLPSFPRHAAAACVPIRPQAHTLIFSVLSLP